VPLVNAGAFPLRTVAPAVFAHVAAVAALPFFTPVVGWKRVSGAPVPGFFAPLSAGRLVFDDGLNGLLRDVGVATLNDLCQREGDGEALYDASGAAAEAVRRHSERGGDSLAAAWEGALVRLARAAAAPAPAPDLFAAFQHRPTPHAWAVGALNFLATVDRSDKRSLLNELLEDVRRDLPLARQHRKHLAIRAIRYRSTGSCHRSAIARPVRYSG
jgi:hypothetical protein